MTGDLDFDLPNEGAGGSRTSLAALSEEDDWVVLLFQRDHHCGNCRRQVQAVAERYDEFRERGAEVVSIVPEPPEKVREWQASYDLPFPLLSDDEREVSDRYDQPVRFGLLGNLSDLVGRMPKAVVLDTRREVPTIVYVHEGTSTWDRPAIDDLLGAIDDAA
jgi:thioredoxin-dependent peroxiredoxin